MIANCILDCSLTLLIPAGSAFITLITPRISGGYFIPIAFRNHPHCLLVSIFSVSVREGSWVSVPQLLRCCCGVWLKSGECWWRQQRVCTSPKRFLFIWWILTTEEQFSGSDGAQMTCSPSEMNLFPSWRRYCWETFSCLDQMGFFWKILWVPSTWVTE